LSVFDNEVLLGIHDVTLTAMTTLKIKYYKSAHYENKMSLQYQTICDHLIISR